MKTVILAGSVLASLALIAAPLDAQEVSGEVVVRHGPVTGRVGVGNEYSSYGPAYRRVVVVERHAPRVLVVKRMRHGHWKNWRRNGYRQVVVYYIDGRYYDRYYADRRGVRRVVVYERGGRFYRAHSGRGHGHHWGRGDRDD